MTDDVISKEDVRQAVKDGVEDALTTLGFDHANPLEVQADLLYLRSMRKGKEALAGKAAIGIFGAIGVALTSLLVLGFREFIGS